MDMPCCLALEGVFHGWGRDLGPFFNYFFQISPCRGRRSPSVGGSGERGSPGGGAGRSRFPRPTKLGPWGAAGRAGQERTRGDRSTPRYKILKNGNAIFVTTQSPKRPIDAGKFDLCMPTEGPALKTERKIQNPASSEPQKRPFLGDRFVPPYCRTGVL
jgi:hypothetical protein